jgi:hypothetical protein
MGKYLDHLALMILCFIVGIKLSRCVTTTTRLQNRT